MTLLLQALRRLRGVPQSPVHHPEGDALTHTLLVARAAKRIALREGLGHNATRKLRLAALAHDLGKATHTQVHADGRITAHGHEGASAAVFQSLCHTLEIGGREADQITAVIAAHMDHVQAKTPRAARRIERKLALSGAPLEFLVLLVEADHSGRAPLPASSPAKDLLKLVLE